MWPILLAFRLVTSPKCCLLLFFAGGLEFFKFLEICEFAPPVDYYSEGIWFEYGMS